MARPAWRTSGRFTSPCSGPRKPTQPAISSPIPTRTARANGSSFRPRPTVRSPSPTAETALQRHTSLASKWGKELIMADDRSTRRKFLEQAGKLGTIPLIGTAMAAAPFQVNNVPQLNGKAKSVTIPTHEFAGPGGAPWLEERLDFPATWDIHVMEMAGHNQPALTPRQIADQCSNPIGARSLRELAEGKKTVAISFDDLTRT